MIKWKKKLGRIPGIGEVVGTRVLLQANEFSCGEYMFLSSTSCCLLEKFVSSHVRSGSGQDYKLSSPPLGY